MLVDHADGCTLLDKDSLETKLGFEIPWYTYLQVHHICTQFGLHYIVQKCLTSFECVLHQLSGKQKGMIA